MSDPYAPPVSRVEDQGVAEGRFRAPIFTMPTSTFEEVPLPPPPPSPDPRLAGTGPAEFTTSLVVEPFPSFVWDTNRYYRDLGVPYWATKREIVRAYQEGGGSDNARKTFVFKQLLNNEIRARYDATEFGSVFFDEVIAEHVKRQMAEDAAAQRASGQITEEDLSDIDVSEYMDKSFQVVDTHRRKEQDGLSWGWGYYLWLSEANDTTRLRQWQELLVRSLGNRGETVRLAVGFVGGHGDSCEVRYVGYRLVVFLHESEAPTPQLADEAADRVVQHRQGTQVPIPER